MIPSRCCCLKLRWTPRILISSWAAVVELAKAIRNKHASCMALIQGLVFGLGSRKERSNNTSWYVPSWMFRWIPCFSGRSIWVKLILSAQHSLPLLEWPPLHRFQPCLPRSISGPWSHLLPQPLRARPQRTQVARPRLKSLGRKLRQRAMLRSS